MKREVRKKFWEQRGPGFGEGLLVAAWIVLMIGVLAVAVALALAVTAL